jgi:hypothetical protein
LTGETRQLASKRWRGLLARTGYTEQGGHDSIDRTGWAEQDGQDRMDRTGQTGQNLNVIADWIDRLERC